MGDEEYIDITTSNNHKEQAEVRKKEGFRKLSTEEQKKQIKKGRVVTDRTTVLYRQAKRNLDMILLGVIIVIFTAAGYILARIRFGFSVTDIRIGIQDFLEVLTAVVAGIVAIVWMLFTKVGTLRRKLSERGNKDEGELDEFGRTIVKRE